jgi:cytochrome c oxidase subunit 2
MTRWGFVAGPLALALTGCVAYDQQSALDPAGPAAGSVHRLWYLMLVVGTVAFVLVVAALLLVTRRRMTVPLEMDDIRSPAREASAKRAVIVAVAATVVVLFMVLVFDLGVARGLAPDAAPSLSIHVIGHQWWWEIEYEDSIPQRRVRLANEIHLPVGQRVLVKLDSHDVIHSFWVPNLAGKRDLIPGHHTQTWIHADRPGVYRAQCAEFCGLEHAKMSLFVVAESRERFTAWLDAQRASPLPPTDTLAVRGRLVLESGSCAMCHTVASTLARGRVGPDLTHVASRNSLAAGTLPNTPGYLAGWIVDPQTIKPGAQMPANQLSPADLRAVVAYLTTLR